MKTEIVILYKRAVEIQMRFCEIYLERVKNLHDQGINAEHELTQAIFHYREMDRILNKMKKCVC